MNITDRWSLGQTIKELRTGKGISVRKMAEICDISPTTVQNVENGSFSPRVDLVIRMIEILGASIRIEEGG